MVAKKKMILANKINISNLILVYNIINRRLFKRIATIQKFYLFICTNDIYNSISKFEVLNKSLLTATVNSVYHLPIQLGLSVEIEEIVSPQIIKLNFKKSNWSKMYLLKFQIKSISIKTLIYSCKDNWKNKQSCLSNNTKD